MKIGMYSIIYIIPSSSIHITLNPYRFVAENGYSETDFIILHKCKGETDALVIANDYRRLYNIPEVEVELNYRKRWLINNKEKYNRYNLSRYHDRKRKL